MKRKFIKALVFILLGISVFMGYKYYKCIQQLNTNEQEKIKEMSTIELKDIIQTSKLQSLELDYDYTYNAVDHAKRYDNEFLDDLSDWLGTKKATICKRCKAIFSYDLSNIEINKEGTTYIIKLDKNNIAIALTSKDTTIKTTRRNFNFEEIKPDKIGEFENQMDKEMYDKIDTDYNKDKCIQYTKDGLTNLLNKLNINYKIIF